MKILRKNKFRGLFGTQKRNEDGLATVVFITLLAIMVMLVAANSMALVRLHKEVRFLEQQQVKRLNGLQTNSAPASLNSRSGDKK
jgi:hypothetical protein